LQAETELFGFTVSGHPLELFDYVAWGSYCPVSRLREHVGKTVTTCGLIVEQRTHHQVAGDPMKFLSLAVWTGIIETELFASTYKTYGLATVRYPILEVEATVEPFENGRGYSLRVLRAGKPRTRFAGSAVTDSASVAVSICNRSASETKSQTATFPNCLSMRRALDRQTARAFSELLHTTSVLPARMARLGTITVPLPNQ
jgi:DNA polymerase III alpha subunit